MVHNVLKISLSLCEVSMFLRLFRAQQTLICFLPDDTQICSFRMVIQMKHKSGTLGPGPLIITRSTCINTVSLVGFVAIVSVLIALFQFC